jgi:hypothetical protein
LVSFEVRLTSIKNTPQNSSYVMYNLHMISHESAEY